MKWLQEIAYVKSGRFNRNIYVGIKDKEEIINHFKSVNYRDCYKSIYTYSNIEDIDESLIYGPLVFDLDMDFEVVEDYDRLIEDFKLLIGLLYEYLGLTEDEYKVYFSGNKGFHIIVPPQVLGVKPMKKLNLYYKNIALLFRDKMKHDTLDLSIYDKRRVLRVNNTINNKSGRHKIEVTVDEVLNKEPSYIGRLAMNKRSLKRPIKARRNEQAFIFMAQVIKRANNKVKGNKILNQYKEFNNERLSFPCVQELINNKDIKGERNNRCVMLASVLTQCGYSKDKVQELMEAWNESLDEPLSHNELNRTVKSAVQMISNGRSYGCGSLSEYECNRTCKIYNR